MKVTPIKTGLIKIGQLSLEDLLNEHPNSLEENSILAISSKVVSICEGNVVNLDSINEDQLWHEESDFYVDASESRYNHHFGLKGNTLLGRAGIDKSNADGHYVLWPANPQKSANHIRAFLKARFGVTNLGVIITDSVSIPMRRGAVGSAIAYSGFTPLKNYIGTPDLFNREFVVEQSNLAEGLAAAATLVMGEGAEQTPIAIMQDLPASVEFCVDDPTTAELSEYKLNIETDVFEVLWKNAPWQEGGRLAEDSEGNRQTDQN